MCLKIVDSEARRLVSHWEGSCVSMPHLGGMGHDPPSPPQHTRFLGGKIHALKLLLRLDSDYNLYHIGSHLDASVQISFHCIICVPAGLLLPILCRVNCEQDCYHMRFIIVYCTML